VNAIQFSKLTHINYAFLIHNADGSVQWPDDVGRMQYLVQKAHENNVKVFISVGGYGGNNNANWAALASTGPTRDKFISTMVNFCKQYNLDGVDIDWYVKRNSQHASHCSSMH
jgi:chitinase